MPYIAIKTLAKDERIKKETCEKLIEVFAEMWGCGKESVTISIEECDASDIRSKIAVDMDKVYVLHGKFLK